MSNQRLWAIRVTWKSDGQVDKLVTILSESYAPILAENEKMREAIHYILERYDGHWLDKRLPETNELVMLAKIVNRFHDYDNGDGTGAITSREQ